MNKKILLIFLALTIITSSTFCQQEQNPDAFTIEKLKNFNSMFGASPNSETVFHEFNRICRFMKLPEKLKDKLVTLLSFEKPGILALFGPEGETLVGYIKNFSQFLSDPNKDLRYYRMRYLRKIIFEQNFDLLAEVIEFGTKNGFKFEPDQLLNYGLLNVLSLTDISQELALRIINNLSPHLVNFQDEYGFTPLMDALHRNHLDLAKLFIHFKTNLEVKSTRSFYPVKFGSIYEGSTALQIAALNKNLELFKLLLHSGADFDVLDLNSRETTKEVKSEVKDFLEKQKTAINSALHDELPRVLVDIVCEYLEKKEKKHD